MPNGVRAAAAVATVVVVGVVVGGCGADNPYCDAVEANQTTLNTFGAKKSDAAWTKNAKAVSAISKVAPSPINEQWASLARATGGVVAAHQDVGFALQDMTDADRRAALSAGDIKVLNKAYQKFDDTTSQRKAVVADVKKTCDIQLK